jgi:hypothetical protein
MIEKPMNFAQFELAKAKCLAMLKVVTIDLAMLEILQAEGGEMKAIDLVTKLTIEFNELGKTPRELCKQMGFDPDEMVGLRKWL